MPHAGWKRSTSAPLASLGSAGRRSARSRGVPARGQCVTDLQARAETLAAYLQVREVQVARDPDNARYAEVRLVRRDTLVEP